MEYTLLFLIGNHSYTQSDNLLYKRVQTSQLNRKEPNLKRIRLGSPPTLLLHNNPSPQTTFTPNRPSFINKPFAIESWNNTSQ